MLQFLRFAASLEGERIFKPIGGFAAWKFFAVRIAKLIILLYSTLFIAASLDIKWAYKIIYFSGAFISMIFFFRIVNDILKFIKYKGCEVVVSPKGIEFRLKNRKYLHQAENITYCEINLLGNLIVRERYAKTVFPFNVFPKEEKTAFVSLFQDLAPRRTRTFHKIYEIFDAVIVALILAMHIRQFIIQPYYIPTSSMEDTLLVGDHLLSEKITFGPIFPRLLGMKKEIRLPGLRKIKRGDIVIFRPPDEEERDFIKRCIAVEGDIFHIDETDGTVYVNGQKLEEPYVKCPRISGSNCTDYRNCRRAIEGRVPPGHILVLGDNRTNSQDSRCFGYVPIERVRGRAFVRYWNTSQVIFGNMSTRRDFFLLRFGLIR
ncbi:MAG: signal peptidase I [Spirochaetes bacterium]|nr:signal peptidase I [Spirochaetota bacterium]